MITHHPDEKQIIIMVSGSTIMAEIELFKAKSLEDNDVAWIAIGNIGGTNSLVIDAEEWSAFAALIKEVDELVQLERR